jgi:long-subunit fatty acid transport protein
MLEILNTKTHQRRCEMKKLVMSVFAVALFASAASAYEWTVGGQVGYDYNKIEGSGNPLIDGKVTTFTIAPEVAKIINEDTNVGLGLSFEYTKRDDNKEKAFGGYVFGERAVLNPGPFKVFLRGEVEYTRVDTDGIDEKGNQFSIGILPNIQYGLTDRLTLIVSSDVLKLGFNSYKQGDLKVTEFGFNAGDGEIVKVGLKYAF